MITGPGAYRNATAARGCRAGRGGGCHAKASALVLVLMIVLAGEAGASDQPPEPETDGFIGPREFMINSLLPGYAQIRMGRVRQGTFYLASVPLQIAGFVLQTRYLAQVLEDESLQTCVTGADGQWYVYYLPGLNARPDKWVFTLGTVLGLYGTLLATHSQYDLLTRLAPPPGSAAAGDGRGAVTSAPVSLGESMRAPWQPENLFNLEILPVFALSLLPDLSRLDRDTLSSYLARESVPFLGREVTPAGGLALAAGSAVVIAQANAVWEEIAYRGIRLRATGVTGSAVRFGLVHLPNALIPNTQWGMASTRWSNSAGRR